MGRKRNPWVRMYTKILQSADYMEAPLHVRVAWIAILCHASDVGDGGRLISGTKPLDEQRLARLANITVRQAGEALKYLFECGMLEIEDGVFSVSNWDEYQYPSDVSTGRVAKHRAAQENCNGVKTVSETVPETDTEKKQDEEAVRLANLLGELIQANLKELGYKERGLAVKSWVPDIEKLHRIDGVDYSIIERVIRWCQSDDFWKMNILSGAKLRKQFPQLLMKMDSAQGFKPKAGTPMPYFG